MMNTLCKPSKLLLLLLTIAALLPTIAPQARAESGYKAVVTADSMKVYAQEAPYDYLGALPRGTEVTVKAVAGGAALISYSGRTGIAQVSDLGKAADAAEEEEMNLSLVATRETRFYKKPSASSSYATVAAGTGVTVLAVNGQCAKVRMNGKVGYMLYSHLGEAADVVDDNQADEGVRTGNLAVVTNQAARVYADASLSGDSISVDKGARMTLLAVKGDCGMVERNGAIGYIAVSCLEKASGGETTVSRHANPFPSGSNEYVIFAFMTGEMGYNRAAAMGVLANIKYESGYRPVCDGDRGTSYGICQWHAGRKSSLISFCDENGLDYTTLDAQLRFFKYEITGRYSSVHAYLKDVENTAEGAYDAGYFFCFNYEAPAARTSQSTKRATYARDTLWPMK